MLLPARAAILPKKDDWRHEECYYPVDYFKENKEIYNMVEKEIDKNYKYLCKEIAVRAHIVLPKSEEELKFWDEGTDHKNMNTARFLSDIDSLMMDEPIIN